MPEDYTEEDLAVARQRADDLRRDHTRAYQAWDGANEARIACYSRQIHDPSRAARRDHQVAEQVAAAARQCLDATALNLKAARQLVKDIEAALGHRRRRRLLVLRLRVRQDK